MPTDEIPAAVKDALEELRVRLRQPKTIQLALKQYVVGEIVKTLMDLDTGRGPDSSDIPIVATSKVTPGEDDEESACVEETVEVFGLPLYHHQVCATSSGGGGVSVSL